MNAFTRLYTAIKCREPVATAAVIRGGLYTAIAFNMIHWTDAQIAQSLMFIELLLSYWLRENVVTAEKHETAINTALALPEGATRSELAAAVAINENTLKES